MAGRDRAQTLLLLRGSVHVDLELTDTGARVIRATCLAREPDEQFARATFAEVCRWVRGMTASNPR